MAARSFENKFVGKIVTLLFGVVAGILLPLGIATWFCHEFLPFFPGHLTTSGVVTIKYRSRSVSSKSNKSDPMISYEFSHNGERFFRKAQVDDALYEELEEKGPVSVNYFAIHPEWAFPEKSPPGVGKWFSFILAFVTATFVVALGWLVMKFVFFGPPPESASADSPTNPVH